MIARLHICDVGTNGFDDASALVPEDGRQRDRQFGIAAGQIGVAHAGGDQPDQHLVGARSSEVYRLERKRRLGGFGDRCRDCQWKQVARCARDWFKVECVAHRILNPYGSEDSPPDRGIPRFLDC